MRRIGVWTILVGLMMLLSACGAQTPAAAPTPLPTETAQPDAIAGDVGEPIALPFGAMAVIAEANLRVQFTEVVEDSRCPANAMCVQQGQAVVEVLISDGTNPAAPIRLTLASADTQGERARATIGNVVIQIVALDPYPGTVEHVTPQDYVLTLRVEPAA